MTRNNGTWTEAKFRSFIVSTLRTATRRWGPKNSVKKKAWVERGVYWCAGYKKRKHKVPVTLPPKPGNKRRINNVLVDHIDPVVDPSVGFTTWDEYIERMFCEENGLQVLCDECHTRKTNEERVQRNSRKDGGEHQSS